MKQVTINVESREELGGSAASRLRREGYVPGVVYGDQIPAHSLVMQHTQYRKLMSGARGTQLFKFESHSKELNGLQTLVKEVQYDHLNDKVLHLDFYAITEGHRITVTVPVELFGESLAVKQGGCVLNQTAYDLELECLPTEIPECIRIDISQLGEGDSIHASEVPLPAGVELMSDGDLSIVSALLKREEVVAAAPAAAEAAPAEGAAAPAAEAAKK